MSMTQRDEELIADLLLKWEELFELGEDIPAAKLCGRRADLVPMLRLRIELLRGVAWMNSKNAASGSAAARKPSSPAARPKLLAGRYELKEHLGSGGFGEVWRAQDLHLGRPVAVKLPHADKYPSDTDAKDRFWAEARRVAKLSHPGIVTVFDVSQHNGTIFIISELIDGEDLSRRISRAGLLPMREAVRIVIEAARNLHHAHQHNFIHRDIKPSNLLIRYDGRVFITDFGIAIATDEPNDSQKLYGTLPYMAPERQLHNAEQIDIRSDVYSLGVVLYELLTGYLPCDFSPRVRMMRMQGKGLELMSPRSLNPGIPAAIERICIRCLANLPADRYQSAAEIAEDLSRWQIQEENGSLRASFKWFWKVLSNGEIDSQTQGRIQLLLEDRTKVWTARPEKRLLPSLLQTYCIYWMTSRSHWTPQQRKMLSAAGRHQAKRGMFLALFFLFTMAAGFWAWRDHHDLETANRILRQNYEDSERQKKDHLLNLLLDSPAENVSRFVKEIEEDRHWFDPRLRDVIANSDAPQKKLNASLALLPIDPAQGEYLCERLLAASPAEVPVIRHALFPVHRVVPRNAKEEHAQAEAWAKRLWSTALSPTAESNSRLRAACGLAYYDPINPQWEAKSLCIIRWLMNQKTQELGAWADLMRPLQADLMQELMKIMRDASRAPGERDRAALICCYYQPPYFDRNSFDKNAALPNPTDINVTDPNFHFAKLPGFDIPMPPELSSTAFQEMLARDCASANARSQKYSGISTRSSFNPSLLCIAFAFGLLRLLCKFD